MSIEGMHILVAIVLFMMTQFSHEEAFYDPSYLSFGCVNFRNANGKTELQDDFSHKSLHWRCPVVHSVVVEGEISPYENLVISLPNYSSSCSYFLDASVFGKRCDFFERARQRRRLVAGHLHVLQWPQEDGATWDSHVISCAEEGGLCGLPLNFIEPINA